MKFYKYQGTGNDFILLDNREGAHRLSTERIEQLCNRRMGIGADGLMLLEHTDGYDFRMVYYNADGRESTMCGNGGRCIVAFAHMLGIVGNKARFMAIDGPHDALINSDGTVSLHMKNVSGIVSGEGHVIMDTGSPHYVKWVPDVAGVNVFAEGRSIRTGHSEAGINVNFAQVAENRLIVRTYERGVEDETLSCGTGVTAVAIAASGGQTGSFVHFIETPGGQLKVTYAKDTADAAHDVVLTGPAVFVFEGSIDER